MLWMREGGLAAIEVRAQCLPAKDAQIGIAESDLVVNAAQRVPAGIRGRQNGDAPGGRAKSFGISGK